MITYTYIDGVFEVKLTGNISFEDIINYLKDFSELENLPSDILLLYELIKINVDLSVSEIKMISHSAELATKKYKSVKSAFVADSPKLAAYSSLFSETAQDKKTVRRLFSSKEAAIKWLKSH